jgi:biotin carboxylase
MRHVVFVDGNGQVFNAMDAAITAGYRTSFLKSRSFKVYIEDSASRRVESRLGDLVMLDNTTDADAVVAAIEKVHATSPVDAIISMIDTTVVPAARAARRLGLPFVAEQGAARALNKQSMREDLRAAGLPTPGSRVVQTEAEALKAAEAFGYPVIVKPIAGFASIATASVGDNAALRQSWRWAEEKFNSLPADIRHHVGAGLLIEERLTGRMFSVELCIEESRPHVAMISARHRSETDETDALGISMPAELDADEWEAVATHATLAAQALDLRFGFFHIEIMLTPRGPRIIEINPRLMGGGMPMQYNRLTGGNIFETLFRLHLGDPIVLPDPKGYGCLYSLRLRARRDCVLAVSPDLGRLAECRLEVLNLSMPDQFPVDISAQTLLGRFQLRRSTPQEARLAASRFMDAFEQNTGVPLIRPADPPAREVLVKYELR